MAENIFDRGQVYVTRFVGAERPESSVGEDRTCYQFSNGTAFAVFHVEDAIDAALAILNDNPARVTIRLLRSGQKPR